MILVVSYPGEEHTAGVVGCLSRQGREVVQIDLGDFPAKSLTLSWCAENEPTYRVETAGGHVDLSRAGVGWWRRVRPFTIDPGMRSEQDRYFANSETSQAVHGMLDAIGCRWINSREADAAAHHKPYQWAVARRLGLRLPGTLVTNRPEDARSFIDVMGLGRTVFKPFLASINSWRETRLVTHADLDRLELVRYAPVIFQEFIPGVDLRVTVVGDAVFAAEIDAQQTSYPVDMRMVVEEATVRAVELPAEIRDKLLALQADLGLVYGAIDLRRTAEGEYYFLEVNPAGQWHFVEQRTRLPITQAMADCLAAAEDSHAGGP